MSNHLVARSRHFTSCVLFMMLLTLPNTACAGAHVILYAFKGGSDGAAPQAGVFANSGDLYGTTTGGGNSNSKESCGTIYKVKRDRSEIVLHSFVCNHWHGDGSVPTGTLIADSHGTLYGITAGGGSKLCGKSGCGTVFRILPHGKERVIYAFTGGSDGEEPFGGLVADSAGNLFGTTVSGGGTCNCGTVYKITPDGSESVLHAFTGGTDGYGPFAGLVIDSTGNLFGTTNLGGGTCDCGTVFKVASDGTETILHAFAAGGDGAFPEAALIEDSAGDLYGTTLQGGGTTACEGAGCGTVFKVAQDGTESVLYAFQGGEDGWWPRAPLLADGAGNLYGTTSVGGGTRCGSGCGTVFELSPDGTETVLYKFRGATDGWFPLSGLVFDAAGDLMGTTWEGGDTESYCCGTVFKLKL